MHCRCEADAIPRDGCKRRGGYGAEGRIRTVLRQLLGSDTVSAGFITHSRWRPKPGSASDATPTKTHATTAFELFMIFSQTVKNVAEPTAQKVIPNANEISIVASIRALMPKSFWGGVAPNSASW